MCKKNKKIAPPVAEVAPANPLDSFELKKPEPAYDESGNRDYFTEYYNAYKNNYIDQYLEAYKKFKADGILGEFTPFSDDYGKDVAVENADEQKDEIDV